MNKDNTKGPPVPNEISEQTGQFDIRFLLWREFCAKHGVPVQRLPSDLDEAQRNLWDELKERRLRKGE